MCLKIYGQDQALDILYNLQRTETESVARTVVLLLQLRLLW